jgi:hypothetical protein
MDRERTVRIGRARVQPLRAKALVTASWRSRQAAAPEFSGARPSGNALAFALLDPDKGRSMKPHKKSRLPLHRRHADEIDGGEAFVHDSRDGFIPIKEGDVEAFGEEFIAGATSNEPMGELARDETYLEENGVFAFDRYEDEPADRLEFF